MSNQQFGADDGCCPTAVTTEAVSADAAAGLARMFKALGDPVRLRLLSLVAAHEGGEACVCDISGSFDLSQPTISHHLKVLREAGLLESQRRGTWVYHRVAPAAVARLALVLQVAAPSADTAAAVA